MAVTSSGEITLNEIHVEAGGTTATQGALNDADIRGLIGKASGAQNAMNEYYGASSVDDTTVFTSGGNGGRYGYKSVSAGPGTTATFGSSSNNTMDVNGSTVTIYAYYTQTVTVGKETETYIEILTDSSASSSSFDSFEIDTNLLESACDIRASTAYSGYKYWRYNLGLDVGGVASEIPTTATAFTVTWT